MTSSVGAYVWETDGEDETETEMATHWATNWHRGGVRCYKESLKLRASH
jgi:hypothetical protein